jgi:hypothetical protein
MSDTLRVTDIALEIEYTEAENSDVVTVIVAQIEYQDIPDRVNGPVIGQL